MALQLGGTHEAFLSAGASAAMASAAAEELAEYEGRLGGIDNRLTMLDARMLGLDARTGGLDARVTMLTWAVGINVVATTGVLGRLLFIH